MQDCFWVSSRGGNVRYLVLARKSHLCEVTYMGGIHPFAAASGMRRPLFLTPAVNIFFQVFFLLECPRLSVLLDDGKEILLWAEQISNLDT